MEGDVDELQLEKSRRYPLYHAALSTGTRLRGRHVLRNVFDRIVAPTSRWFATNEGVLRAGDETLHSRRAR